MSIMITAKDNEKVKYTKSLLKTKNRTKESKFIIEGYRILTLAIECNADIEYVFINEDFENESETFTGFIISQINFFRFCEKDNK